MNKQLSKELSDIHNHMKKILQITYNRGNTNQYTLQIGKKEKKMAPVLVGGIVERKVQ